jgi:peptidoglycan-N-acetylglucosamine deacetylase
MKYLSIYLLLFAVYSSRILAQERMKPVSWPAGNKVAISLSFDDARLSQADAGIPLLDEYGVKATFYLNPVPMNERLDGWKKAVANGHEIGNHSTTHPCSGNYSWVGKGNELENLTMEEMRKNLLDCNTVIKDKLGVNATLFAYPCGQKFIGRGKESKSYIPLIAQLFSSGRGWLDNMDNDPRFCDYSQLAARDMDGKTFEEILPLINDAKVQGKWLILAGHEMGEDGRQTTRLSMLRKLIEYAKDPANNIWLAPVGEVLEFLKIPE